MATPAQPAVSSFSPPQGRPGVQVIVEGSGFNTAQTVLFHEVKADFTVLSNTRLLAVVPPWALSGPISVVTPTASTTSTAHFTVAPRVFAFFPPRSATNMTVTIFGENFLGATNVTFGGVAAQTFTITAPEQIRAVVPPGATQGPVAVLNPGGRAVSLDDFVVTGPGPIIDQVFPPVSAPGEVVVIEGANFTDVSAVRFNNVPAPFTVPAQSQIHVLVPANAVTGPLTVVTPRGTATAPQPFVVTRAPVVFEFTPTFGAAGMSVVIEGINLTEIRGVGFNRVPVTAFGTPAPNQLHVNVPPAATTGPIYVTNAFGVGVSTNVFTVTAAPIFTEITPMLGPPGTQVVIRGANLNTATAVRFGDRPASFAAVAGTQLNAIVPVGARTGPLSVTNPSGTTSTPVPFVVVGTAPYVLGVLPEAAPRGATISIVGANFQNVQAVRLGGVAAAVFHAVTPDEIHAVVPPSARSGMVSVTTPAGTSTNAVNFHVPPRLTSFSPTNGVAGAAVSLHGTNFLGAYEVQLNQAPAPFTLVSSNLIQMEVPLEGRTGPISVHTLGGDIVSTNSFLVQPVIAGFSPISGLPGTPFTISGTGFFDLQSVAIGNASAPFTRVSSTEITATVPPQAQTGLVRVETASGMAASTNNFLVAGTADLALGQTVSPLTVFPGGEIAYSVGVTNLGPGLATAVLLTNTLPGGVTLISASVTQGSFTTPAGMLRASLGNLPSGANARLQFTLRALTPGVLTNTAVVHSNELDPNLANNVSVSAVTVSGEVLQLVISGSNAEQLRVAWPVAAGAFVLEARPSFAPGTAWQPAPETPQTVGEERVVLIPLTGSSRYFRLREP